MMTDRARWVRRDERKRPLRVSGGLASSTDLGTWSTHAEALKSTIGVGLGFVLGDGIGCVDLDGCLIDGVLADWASEVIDSITEPVIFMEVSQSGEGVHVFIEAPEGRGSKIRDGRKIERYTVGRFIAVTGKVFTK